MRFIAIPFAYLNLRSERGWPTYARDLPTTILVAAMITLPFVTTQGSLFFAKDGFLDKFASFAGVLTGFYVAALIAVASVPSGQTDLDGVITNGPAFFREKKQSKARQLTRRQYVCAMFGYLSFLSLMLSVVAITLVSLSFGRIGLYDLFITRFDYDKASTTALIRSISIFVVAVPIGHMALTTIRGLHYLTDRIYVQAPKMMKRPDANQSIAEVDQPDT